MAALLLAAAVSPPPATGQTASPAQMGGGTVSDIRIEGAQRIEPETIRSYLLIQPGDPWDEETVDKSLKALFATGLFADVNLRRGGKTLMVSGVVWHNYKSLDVVGVKDSEYEVSSSRI